MAAPESILKLCETVDLHKDHYRLIYQYMSKVPTRPIYFNNSDDVAMHDKMVSLVERMLELNKKKADEKNPNS